MSMPTGRSEKRTPIEVAVVLSRLNERPFTERTFTENVSSRGLRAVTRRMWQPGARLLVSFAGECIPGSNRATDPPKDQLHRTDALGRSWPRQRRSPHHYENSCPCPVFPARDWSSS